jgi:hypothetical protein
MKLGTPRMPFEMPREDSVMPTAKPRNLRRHPASLPRFSLEEHAPFTKEGTFSTNASRDFHIFYPKSEVGRRRSEVGDRGRKSGSEVGVGDRGRRSGSEIGVGPLTPDSASASVICLLSPRMTRRTGGFVPLCVFVRA